jgi:hypothetical protein
MNNKPINIGSNVSQFRIGIVPEPKTITLKVLEGGGL